MVISSLPEWITVAKGQMMEILETRTESCWKNLIGHKGRTTMAKTSSGSVDLSFIVKPIVSDINEVVKGALTAAEDKERDKAASRYSK